jgi:hypothetical protein
VRTASSTGVTMILPCPIMFSLSALRTLSMMRSTSSSSTTISTLTFGRRTNSPGSGFSPRAKPRCTPKPLHSVTDMPGTPSTDNALATACKSYAWM